MEIDAALDDKAIALIDWLCARHGEQETSDRFYDTQSVLYSTWKEVELSLAIFVLY